jgi:hypothetical protein
MFFKLTGSKLKTILLMGPRSLFMTALALETQVCRVMLSVAMALVSGAKWFFCFGEEGMLTKEDLGKQIRESEKKLERQELSEWEVGNSPIFRNLDDEEIEKIEKAFPIDISETVAIFLDLESETDSFKEKLQEELEEYFSSSNQEQLTQQQKESINYLYWEEVLSLNELVKYTKLGIHILQKTIEKEIESNCLTCERKITIKIDSIDYFQNLRQKIDRNGFDNQDELMLQHFCKEPCRDEAKNEFENEKIIKTIKIQELKSLPYKDYLMTDHWESLKHEALHLANNSCALCLSNNRQLHVHHKTYKNRGQETQNDLIVLCKDCHKKFHGIQ